MTGQQTFVARAALGVAAAVCTMIAVRWRGWYRWSADVFERVYLSAFAGTRLLLFALIFLVARLPVRGDLPAYYVPEAMHWLAGMVPYNDYRSSYAPLFGPLYGTLYRLHPSPLTLIVFAIAVEVVTAFLWLRVLRAVLRPAQARAAALLCLVNPISLQFVTVDGQNNAVIAFCLALAVWLLLRRREVLSGVALGLSICVIKFLPLLFVPAFALRGRRVGALWTAGCCLVVAGVYGVAVFGLHLRIWVALMAEGVRRSADGLPYVVESLTGLTFNNRALDGLVLVAMAALMVHTLMLTRRRPLAADDVRGTVLRVLPSMVAYLLTLMALAKKTWPTYSVMVLFPLAAVMESGAERGWGWVSRRGRELFVFFSVISVTVHSYWASILGSAPAGVLHAMLLGGSLKAWTLLLVEIVLLALYAWLVTLALAEEAEVGRVTAG